jgi:transcriptional regulator with XRE-family HTH domain
MQAHVRIKMARRHLKLSQNGLAEVIGVHRSAVSQWESPLGKNPTLRNLRKLAELSAVQFEWLATGRGSMALTRNEELESVATAHAVLVDDPIEMRMVVAMRAATIHARMALVEMAEELAASRVGRKPKQS